MVIAELGRGWGHSGLRRAKDIPSSKIELLWLLLYYTVIMFNLSAAVYNRLLGCIS